MALTAIAELQSCRKEIFRPSVAKVGKNFAGSCICMDLRNWRHLPERERASETLQIVYTFFSTIKY